MKTREWRQLVDGWAEAYFKAEDYLVSQGYEINPDGNWQFRLVDNSESAVAGRKIYGIDDSENRLSGSKWTTHGHYISEQDDLDRLLAEEEEIERGPGNSPTGGDEDCCVIKESPYPLPFVARGALQSASSMLARWQYLAPSFVGEDREDRRKFLNLLRDTIEWDRVYSTYH